jgi:hypothetical protein
MQKKDPRGYAGRGIAVPSSNDSAAAAPFLVSLRTSVREALHGVA